MGDGVKFLHENKAIDVDALPGDVLYDELINELMAEMKITPPLMTIKDSSTNPFKD